MSIRITLVIALLLGLTVSYNSYAVGTSVMDGMRAASEAQIAHEQAMMLHRLNNPHGSGCSRSAQPTPQPIQQANPQNVNRSDTAIPANPVQSESQMDKYLSHESLEVLQMKAESNDVLSQLALGFRYEDGIGGVKNLTKALYYFELAANNGVSPAQYHVAHMYRQGYGTIQNNKKAKKYYELAAKQGHPIALTDLSIMYGTGTGVAQDYVKAYGYILVALAVDSNYVNAKNVKAILDKEITEGQKNSAIEFAKNYYSKIQ